MAQGKTQKKYSTGRVMDVRLDSLVSIGIYKAVKEHTDNHSQYVRGLIMKDLNIDELGNKL